MLFGHNDGAGILKPQTKDRSNMNLQQTCAVLSYLAATHPNFPKYTPEDKQRVAASYFRILYKYSLQDVLNAVDCACRRSRPFLPCVYDIEYHINLSLDIERYLSSGYYDLERELSDLKALSSAEIHAMTYDQLNDYIADIKSHETIITQLREEAYDMALYEYEKRESDLSLDDRKKLGMAANESNSITDNGAGLNVSLR